MGGKSRKSGGISAKLVAAIKNGTLGKNKGKSTSKPKATDETTTGLKKLFGQRTAAED